MASVFKTLGLGNLADYPVNKVYAVLGVWTLGLVFAIVALVEGSTQPLYMDSESEFNDKTKKQLRANIFSSLTLLMFALTFYFALMLL